ncbi:oligomeric, coiled-coil, peripheral membrane protein [Pseudocyphellaria aurata]|nr:oligomeric, coiled-coil, peripheral membrane protein [Pseudocyphellaria aurata]
MTARGKQVKLQTLQAENEIFLYDRRILSSSTSESLSTLLPKTPVPGTKNLREPPDSLSDGNSLQAWQTLFKKRRAWSIQASESSYQSVDEIRRLEIETGVVQRSAAIAVENIKQHVGNLRPKFEDSRAWAHHIIEDQTFLLGNWQSTFNAFSSIAIFEDLGRCLQSFQVTVQEDKLRKGFKSNPTLHDVVDVAQVTKASDAGGEISRRFKASVTNLTTVFEKVFSDAHEIIESFSRGIALSDDDLGEQAGRLMEEIEVITKKINADYEFVLGLPNTQKTISQVSKTALLHTRNLLPSLLETTSDIDQLLRDTTERKRKAMISAVQYMQQISQLESTVAQIHAQLANLGLETEDGEAFDMLNFLIKLPFTYGALLIECVRRREWNEKITTDSSSLVEEMATFKEEETRRRKKWIKDMGGVVRLDDLDDMSLGVEVNIHAQKQAWPNVSRQDVTKYTRTLQELGIFEGIHGELEELAKTLDSPTKQQAKRAKAFKNGSFHEAAFGRNSLLLRGDDDLLQLAKAEKSKLEDKLKSSESRIRKLEDLLHRQSQITRVSTNNTFGISNGPNFERHATSPTLNYTSSLSKAQDNSSRRSSVSSRRISMNHEPEEKTLVQRILSLESELGAEKAQSAALQQSATTRLNVEDELKLRVQEAVSTKEDLMGNLEAQQREFDGERRSLEDENAKLKLKLEEVEDELDRVLENRDHEERIHALEEELEKVRTGSAIEVQKAQGQVEFLRNDYTMQREKANKLERQVNQQGDENAEISAKANELFSQLQTRQNSQAEQYRTLRAALLQLSKDESAPEDFGALVDLIELSAEKSAGHLNHIEESLETTRAENLRLETRAKDYAEETNDLRERLGTEEIEVFSLRESLAEKRTRFESLQGELDKERRQHQELQSDSEATKTSFELLQETLGERESRLANLQGEIATLGKQVQQLEVGLASGQSQLEDLQKVYENLRRHTAARASRAEDISTRLYTQNLSLSRLLEQIGFAVTKQDDTMVILKVSRAVNASTVLSDPSASMNRSISASLPATSTMENAPPPSTLRWISDDSEVEASKFNEFVQDIDSFNIDSFSDAITKRIKETEHTTRKWQREARAYRDKAHRAQSEAHEKIAFRTFKEGDLALFLPTRNQATRPWAAFNVGAPHYFLREQDSHKLRTRDWLLARISKVEERVVDLSKSLSGLNPASDRRSIGDASDGGASYDDENPFELSDGLRWYLLDATEEKPGAPISIGLSKVTVASANIDAKGSVRIKNSLDGQGATKTLTRSLDSRRSSSNSKKGLVAVTSSTHPTAAELGEMLETTPASNDAKPSDVQSAHPADEPGSSIPRRHPTEEGNAILFSTSPTKPHPPRELSPRRPSPEKAKSRAWDSLWSLDLSLESAKGKR